uniref:Uncharacterized protein n=1 Tax=Bionectria ochroleuca TaxID=29856 RepID=A0A8H7KCV6_BIOOC
MYARLTDSFIHACNARAQTRTKRTESLSNLSTVAVSPLPGFERCPFLLDTVAIALDFPLKKDATASGVYFRRQGCQAPGEIVWWHRQANDRGGTKPEVKNSCSRVMKATDPGGETRISLGRLLSASR